MNIKVYNSSEVLVFSGDQEEFSQFPLNDSDRVVISKGE